METNRGGIRRYKLRDGWYSFDNREEFDLSLSGVYEWRIAERGLYVGKAKVLESRINAYPNNVRRMLDGLSWHGNPEKNYRLIHRELRKAYDDGRSVTVVVLETCEPENRTRRERWWIQRRQEEALLGGPQLLNAHTNPRSAR